MLSTKTEVRKTVGRGKFTVKTLAEATEVTPKTARKHLSRLVEDGLVERLDETEKVLTPDGEPSRGRPRHLFRVVKGK